MIDTSHQYRAFMAVVIAMALVCLCPMVAALIWRVALPDGLLSVADKGITAFGTLLGTIGGLMFRQNQADATRADNTGKALDTVAQAIAAAPPGRPTGTPKDPISVEEVN